MSALLTVRDLAVSIADVRICRNLDISIASGSRWAILGRNGCGKTTLLKTLAGLHAQDGGEIRLHDESLETIPAGGLARRRGVLFQEHAGLFPGTVLDAAMIVVFATFSASYTFGTLSRGNSTSTTAPMICTTLPWLLMDVSSGTLECCLI